MTPPWMSETLDFCVRWIGHAIVGSAVTARAVAVATLSTAEVLLDLMNCHIADDVSQIKDSLIKKQRSEAELAEAEATKRLAEAAAAANQANLHKRKDRMAAIERDRLQLQNAKTQAEIHAILSDAEARKIQAVAEAKARLIEAISKVKQDGGGVFFDEENLRKIMELPSVVPPKVGVIDSGVPKE